MKRSSKKALALAVGGIFASAMAPLAAHADNVIWQTTGLGNSQDFNTAANWLDGVTPKVPGIADTALFNINIPPSNTVTFAAPTSTGAIVDQLANGTTSSNLTFGGAGTLSLYGQNYVTTFQYGNATPPPTLVNVTQSFTNVILAESSNQSTNLKKMTLNAGLTLSLVGANSTIVAAPGFGSSFGQSVVINGVIQDGPGVHSALTILGGGNVGSSTTVTTTDGGSVTLGGSSNTFSGGIVIGNAAGTEGAQLNVNYDAITTANGGTTLGSVVGVSAGTGDIVINEQSQILLTGNGTGVNSGSIGGVTSAGTSYFFQTGQNITVNGIGINKNISGAIRTAGGSTYQTYDILANVKFNSAAAANLTNGAIVLSPTSSDTRVIQFSGVVSGSAGLNKQGSGSVEFSNPSNTWTGYSQIGNGAEIVDAGCTLGIGGDVIMFQTSTNFTELFLHNATQLIGNLSSNFTATTGNAAVQENQGIALIGPGNGAPGTALQLNQSKNTTFGYGNSAYLYSFIGSAGSVQLNSGSTGTLTLTGSNTYTGGTTINGGTLNVANGTGFMSDAFGVTFGAGSATGFGDVTVNSGGKLASGGNVKVLGNTITSGSIAGSLNINNGGILSPGGDNLVGSINIGGNLNANNGSIINVDLIGGTNVNTDQINVAGNMTVTGTSTVNLVGSKLAFGNYTLFNVNSLTGGTLPTIGAVPNSASRHYSLNYVNNNSIVLEITDTGTDRFWSVGGGTPPADGTGSWSNGSTNFFVQNGSTGTAGAAYDNTSSADLIIGNAGNAGTITLASPVVVGGPLVFSPVNGAYAINGSGANTLQLNSGIVSSNTTSIGAAIVLGASQTFSTGLGTTLTLGGGISETGGSQTLTTADQGTIVLGGTSTYTGGTIVSQGTLKVTTSSLPATGGVNVATSANLVFGQSATGTYAGVISGTGTITINNASGAATNFSNVSNSYTGTTNIQAGVLAVDNVNELGGGASSINLSGGTLQFAANNLVFPGPGSLIGTDPHTTVTLATNTTSVIDSNGNNVVMNQNIGGAGSVTKIGAGNVTWTGLPSTTVIGELSVLGGTLTLAPPTNVPSFGFSGDPVATNTFTGDLTLGASIDLRIFGGILGGGGKINVEPAGIVIESRGATVIDNTINVNPGGQLPFAVNISANATNSMTINSTIQGNTDVGFTGGAGTVILGGTSTYTGNTTIDQGAGEVQITVNNALPATTGVHITGGSILDLLGVTQTIASLDAGSSSAAITNESNTPSTLVISGTAATTYAGFLLDSTSTLGLTLNQTAGGSLTLTNPETLIGVVNTQSGMSGPLTINSGQIDIQSLTTLGAPSTITVGLTPNNSQLRYDGVSGTQTYADAANGNVPPSQVNFVMDGLGGFTPAGGGPVDPGAISVENTSIVTIPNNITLAATSGIQVDSTSSLTLPGNISGTGGLVATGGGTLNLNGANSYSGGTTINSTTVTFATFNSVPAGGAITTNMPLTLGFGTPATPLVIGELSSTSSLTVAPGAALQIAPGSGANTVTSLSLGTGATLDITKNNTLVVNYGAAPDPVSAIRIYLKSGYNGGLWNGTGLTSSSVAAEIARVRAAGSGGVYGIGYVDGGVDKNQAANALFKATGNQIVYAPALIGDANLDGSVTFIDLGIVAQNLGGINTDWEHGDFNYDGTTNFLDIGLLAQNLNKNILNTPLSEIVPDPSPALTAEWNLAIAEIQANQTQPTNLPEPGMLSLLAVGAGGLLARRRRR